MKKKEKKILKQVVGIDCSKNQLDVCLGELTEQLEAVHKATASFPNNSKGFKKLLAWSRKLSDPSVPIHFVVEATGVYHEKLSVFLADSQQRISIVLPNKAHNFAKTLSVRTITDKESSKMLCTMGLEKKLDLWQKPDPVYSHLKRLTRERERLMKEKTASINQLHAEKHSAYASNSTINRYKKRIAFIEKQCEEIMSEIKNIIEAHAELKKRIEKICTIPGVGLLTVVTVVAETNGFNLFRNEKQLASYAGYDVIVKESGTSVRGKAHISKKGNSHLRKAMYFPAISIRNTQNPSLNNFFQRVLAKHPDIPMKAYVAVGRKLLLLIYALWKKNEVFDADYKSKKTSAKTNTQHVIHEQVKQEERIKQEETSHNQEHIIAHNDVAVATTRQDDIKRKKGKQTAMKTHRVVLDAHDRSSLGTKQGTFTCSGTKKIGQQTDAALHELVHDRS